MPFGKKLKMIAVFQAPQQVGFTLAYDSGPQDHILLPLGTAESFRDRLIEACEKARQEVSAQVEQGGVTNDRVSVSEKVSLNITTPTQ